MVSKNSKKDKEKKKYYKLESVLNLCDLPEIFFESKLKRKNPRITQKEINKRKKEWMLERPYAPFGDGEGIVGDIGRFLIK